MDLKDFSLLKEDEGAYTIRHPQGKSMTIPKEGLSDKAHALIKKLKPQHFDEGGEVNSDSVQDSPEQIVADAQSTQPAPPQVQEEPVQRAPASQDPIVEKINQSVGPHQEEKAANLNEANAISNEGKAQAQAIQDAQAKIDALPSQNDILASYKAKDDALMKAYQDQKIDPNRYLSNMSTGGKIAAAIGLILGGAGAGKNGENYGVTLLHNSIANDIEAQKNDQSKALNLWRMNHQAYGDEASANLATANQLYTGLKYKVEQAAAQSKGPIAMANAQRLNAQIDQKLAENRLKLSLLNPTSDNPDPSTRVQFLVPPDKQQKVFEEIEANKATAQNGPKILEAFDNAANKLHAVDFIPTWPWNIPNADQKAMHALLGPTFKDVEGTVRQAAMDNMFENVTPQFGDNKRTTEIKRNALINYLKSKSSTASASKGFGIDLTKFPATNFKPQDPGQAYAGQVQTMNGVKYQKVQGGWQRVQ